MFKKILKVSEKVLFGLFILSYVIHFILNIGISRLTEIADITSLILFLSTVLYAIISPLRNLSIVILFLITTTILGILTSLLTPLALLGFTEWNLAIFIMIYLVVFVKSFVLIKQNGFLMWLISIASIIIFLYFVILILNIQGGFGPTEKVVKFLNIFIYSLFIIVSLAMIFGLPNSNYPDWKKEHRQLFVRLILSVWLFIFIISTLRLLIPFEQYKEKLFPEMKAKWEMKNYEYEEKPGLK